MRLPQLNKKESFLAIIVWCQLWLIAGGVIWAWKLYPLRAEIKALPQENKIEIEFNQPVIFFTDNAVQITPLVEVKTSIASDSHKLVFLVDGLKPGTVYNIQVKGVRSWLGASMSSYNSSFFVPEDVDSAPLIDTSPVALPDIQQGRIFRRLAGKWATLSEPKYTQGKYIDVDINQQALVMYKDGKVFAAFEISSGKKGYATPKGEFRVLSKQENHWSAQYHLWMPYSLNFSGGYFIHELPYWPSGYREGEDHLGRPVSHGCIRLGIGAAKEVYDYSEVGTMVYIH